MKRGYSYSRYCEFLPVKSAHTMNKELLFDSHIAAESCVAMYRTSGLRNLLLFLLDTLQPFLPVARINALYCTANADVLVTMSDTNKVNVSNKFAEKGLLPPMLLRERITEDVIVGDIGAVIPRPPKTGGAFACDMPYLFHNSMLRIPLFRSSTAVFLLCFWSKEFHAFDDEDLAGLHRLLAPLAAELEDNLSGIDLNAGTRISPRGESGKEKICLCPGLQDVKAQIEAVADVDTTVLILGETGVGKEAVADMIHELSSHRDGPLIKVNCGAIPPDLVDSELFGHEKGAFTGAASSRQGYFEMADGGTIFLDEIGEMPGMAQVRLLRILTDGMLRRVGGSRYFPVHVRVIAATQENLLDKLEAGLFRQDLWFRLSVYPILVPPLRRRLHDIPVLLNHFLLKKSKELRLPFVPEVEEGEMNVLCRYAWPGNVRELENVVEKALLQCKARNSRTIHFSPDGSAALRTTSLPEHAPEKTPGERASWPSLKEYEERYIAEVIEHCGGKLSGPGGATEILKIHYNTLKSHMKHMGLPLPGARRRR